MLRYMRKILIISLILLLVGVIAITIHYSRLEPIPLEKENILTKTEKIHSDLERIRHMLNKQKVLLETAIVNYSGSNRPRA